MTKKNSRPVRFQHTPLYKVREPSAWQFLSQRSSFWVATLSISAFVMGNMVGQHGWYAFWAAVMGQEEIAYEGVVSPIDQVPDYVAWARYGGEPHLHTFKQVPKNVLVPLPSYSPSQQKNHMETSAIGQIYSVGHLGSYETGGDNDGSHPGVDIRVPVGTPVRSIANGIVYDVRENDAGGFGTVVVIKHPNVPDPARPNTTTTLYSIYAHLSAAYPMKHDVVRKGELIALTGQTGFATGPHLHFQIDRDEAPWHPYWPFSAGEARNAGLSFVGAINAGLHQERGHEYTVHPMLYVQANYKGGPLVASATDRESGRSETRTTSVRTTVNLRDRAAQRAAERAAARPAAPKPKPVTVVARPKPAAPVVISKQDVATIDPQPIAPTPPPPAPVPSEPLAIGEVKMSHDGFFGGSDWETVTITVRDLQGNVAANPDVGRGLYLRLGFGEAEFDPPILTSQHFKNGTATFRVLPRGRRTIVIQVQPLGALSKPMQFKAD